MIGSGLESKEKNLKTLLKPLNSVLQEDRTIYILFSDAEVKVKEFNAFIQLLNNSQLLSLSFLKQPHLSAHQV